MIETSTDSQVPRVGSRGLTSSPLMGPPGAPTAFRSSLKYDAVRDLTVLEYVECPTDSERILGWTGHDGTFADYTVDQKWQSALPPGDIDQGPTPSFRHSLASPGSREIH